MAGLDNKISNVLGAALPYWLKRQIQLRSQYNNQANRDDLNVSYLTNQTAWVRLVSSVNINGNTTADGLSGDMNYFKYTLGISDIQFSADLAKKYMLFGGTTQYINQNENKLRFGLGQDGAYGMLGEQEINKFGYRPMPGITDVKIETQGRLGSVRMATINFKVWDKMQLDVMDALYFKLGYTMLLEWGHTIYISQEANSPVQFNYSEFYAIDPFQSGITKEKLNLQLAQNSRKSEGNYDGMLGMVTNFNFSFTQEGGYDCSLKIIGLGAIGDSLKINNASNFPNIVKSELKSYYDAISTAQIIARNKAIQDEENKRIAEVTKEANAQISGKELFLHYINNKVNPQNPNRNDVKAYPTQPEIVNIVKEAGVLNSNTPSYDPKSDTSISDNIKAFDFIYDNDLYIQKFGVKIPHNDTQKFIKSISLNTNLINEKINYAWGKNLVNTQDGSANATPYDYLYSTRTFIPNTPNAFTFTIPSYTGNNGESYYLYIDLFLPTKITYIDISKTAKSALESILTKQPTDFSNVRLISNNKNYTIILSGVYKTSINFSKTASKEIKTSEGLVTADVSSVVPTTVSINYNIQITDSALISNIIQENDVYFFSEYLQNQQDENVEKIKDEFAKNQASEAPDQQSIDAQIDSSLRYQSNLELAIKAIELYSLTQAVKDTSNLDIGRTVKKYALSQKPYREDFLNKIFEYTIFNGFLDSLFDGTIKEDSTYGTEEEYVNKLIDANDDDRFKIFAKYGFNSSIMGGKTNAKTKDGQVGVPAVDYSELTTTYVVPYEINQPTDGGGQIIHPVYMQLGFLLMIINAMSTIYESEPIDSNTSSPQNKPLVYIDFNPETNLCLTNSLQFTTNPFSFLIPLQATLADYKTLFSSNTVDDSKNEIKAPTSGSASKLYDPEHDPNISGALPKFRAGGNKDAYRGKTMKILVSCEYALEMVKQFADHNGLNKVFLKPFLDQLVVDMNKSLGAMNIFRVAYDDTSNCFTIVDDQVQPLAEGEEAVSQNATDTMPVYGVNSIAKSLNIQTEISSNLSNMVAISANSNSSDQSANSTNASSYGFINNSYRDRYIPVRKDLTVDEIKTQKNQELARQISNYDSILKAEQKFNTTIESFYGTTQPNKDDVSQATNYYIQVSTKTNNELGPTRSSAMIPVSVNFTTHGISGFHMGHAFTLPSDILPYTYSSRHTPTLKDITATDPTSDVKVAFATVGLSHTIQGNVWDTSIKGSMILIKDQNAFSNATINTSYSNAPLLVINPNANIPNAQGQILALATYYGFKGDKLKDTNSVKGIGNRNNQLVETQSGQGNSVALKKSTADAIGVKNGDTVLVTIPDGRSIIVKYDDTIPEYDQGTRIDFYNPSADKNGGKSTFSFVGKSVLIQKAK